MKVEIECEKIIDICSKIIYYRQMYIESFREIKNEKTANGFKLDEKDWYKMLEKYVKDARYTRERLGLPFNNLTPLPSPPKETEKTDAELIEEANAILRLAPPFEPQTAGSQENKMSKEDWNDIANGREQPSITEQTVVRDEFIKKHLKIIMDKALDAMIVTHFYKMFGSLEMASVQHFVDTGRISGSLYLRLKEFALAFAENWHKTAAPQPPQSDAVEFVNWITKEDLKLYKEGWCQPGGSNGMHLSTPELYTLFKSQS